MYYCNFERDCPQADGDEPAGDLATSHDSVHDVLVNKKSNTMLILFSTKENLVSFLCCCFPKVHPSHFTESKDVPSVPCNCNHLQSDLGNFRMAYPMDPVLSHYTSQERQPAAVPELPNDQPHKPPKQSHAEDHTEQIEATSGENHR